jgi:hypothetical protein
MYINNIFDGLTVMISACHSPGKARETGVRLPVREISTPEAHDEFQIFLLFASFFTSHSIQIFRIKKSEKTSLMLQLKRQRDSKSFVVELLGPPTYSYGGVGRKSFRPSPTAVPIHRTWLNEAC